MKRKPTPAPYREFTFVSDAFNLITEHTEDGARLILEQQQALDAKQAADKLPVLPLDSSDKPGG